MKTMLHPHSMRVLGALLLATPIAALATPLGEGKTWNLIGDPCPGSNGELARISLGSAPEAGESVDVLLQDATPNTGAYLMAAIDPAPIDLLGCTLEVGVDPELVAGVLTTSTGSATFDLAVPATPSLLGQRAVVEWIIVDPGGSLLGSAATSDAAEFVIR